MKFMQLRKVIAEKLSADPTAYEGRFYYHTTDKLLKYYNATSWIELLSAGAQTIAGLKTFSSGIKLPSSGGTASTLDHYEEGTTASTFSFNGTGGVSTTASFDLLWRRVGKEITCYVPSIRGTSRTSSTTLQGNTALPARIRPNQTIFYPVFMDNSGTTSTTIMGYIKIDTAGIVEFGRDFNNTAWTNTAANCGMSCSMNFKWIVT